MSFNFSAFHFVLNEFVLCACPHILSQQEAPN